MMFAGFFFCLYINRTQIEHFKSVNERKEKELAEVRARVAQLRLSEQTSKERVAAAEKTIQDNQYVRPEDVSQAKARLSIIQATHRWEPLRSSSESLSSAASGSAFMMAKAGSGTLEFLYDRAVVVVIDPSKIGKDSEAVKVSAFEDEAMVDFDLSLADQQRLHISALACKTRPSMKDVSQLILKSSPSSCTLNDCCMDIEKLTLRFVFEFQYLVFPITPRLHEHGGGQVQVRNYDQQDPERRESVLD